jgi:hypothetical protein
MRHRWKWISGFLVAAILATGFWIWSRPSPPPPEATLAHVPSPIPPWPVSAALSAVKPAMQADHAGEIEVCGVGKVKIDRDDWTATGKFFDARTKKPRMRWLSELRNSDDYRARATGLYLEGIFDRDEPRKDPEVARDELVQLALATKDPAIFALANTKCIQGVEDISSAGACPQLTLDQWTRSDSDNAVPWLQLAAKARKENDSAAEAAAFARAAQSHQYESYNWSLFAFAQASMPSDATAADRWYLTTDLLGVEAAMPMPYITVFQYCSREAMSDATVRRQCNAVAELLVNKATTLLELSLGKSLGTRVGWTPEVIDKLTQQLNASMQALAQMTPSDPHDQWSCDSVARGNAFMAEWDRLGERELAKEEIERSGETVADLSRKFSDGMEKTRREAEAAAPSQSAAAQP